MLNIGLLLRLEVPTVSKVFIDIGTCDFDTSIPLAEAGWRGYMVEADPKYASRMSDKTVPYDVDVFNIPSTDTTVLKTLPWAEEAPL